MTTTRDSVPPRRGIIVEEIQSACSAMSTGATPEGNRSDIAGKLTQHQCLSGSATIGNRALGSDGLKGC
ncbi:uncharacterized protein LY79DRAFT_556435 [Colletotrichum navitas]|uniref:Uncharacterized protein n=1 Tax=Colletotrichum navitas TaxID=681940 RepID=A0AAD8PXP1_9PEZI|nr:uncharacterized protein LY79DRAFT_556435 [Colletotrichum navitas]KAK1589836.1 hypothetical protein LY79DRAFT_556435 [Colletotrichum navitas]